MSIHKTHLLQTSTNGKGTYSLTRQIEELVSESGVEQGVITILVQHTSASLVLMENADIEARHDLHAFFDHLVPENTPYFTHTYEGPDDMPSHIRTVLTQSSQTIPIINGCMALGTWQGIFLFEHRIAPHSRRIAIHIGGV